MAESTAQQVMDIRAGLSHALGAAEEAVAAAREAHAAAVTRRERVVAAAARRVRDDLVEGLLLGRGRDADYRARWAAHLGYDPARAHNVAAIAFELPPSRAADAEPLRQRIRESIEHFMTTRAPEAIVSAREAEVVVVAAASPDPRKLGQACLARLAELFPGAKVVIGIGGACKAPEEIARSYDQAHRTTQTLWRLGRTGAVAAFEDLGIHRLLLQHRCPQLRMMGHECGRVDSGAATHIQQRPPVAQQRSDPSCKRLPEHEAA